MAIPRAHKPAKRCLVKPWTILTAALLSIGATVLRADTPAGWLNVKELGASGSEFQTTAKTTAGSKQIVVAQAGDFKVGQGVMLSKCNPHYVKKTIWGPRGEVGWEKPLGEAAEIRGYDGSQGDWLVLMLDVPKGSTAFRWTEDFSRSWHPVVPISGDWQPLRDGIEVRLNKHDWQKGYTVVLSARGQLVTTIEKVDGSTLTLRDAPTRAVADSVLRHCDDRALQAAIDRAIKEHRNLHVPVGHYRLAGGLRVSNAAGITIEGANPVHTILDISRGNGACIRMIQGTEVTLRNFTMVGHSGFDKRDQCGALRMRGSSYFWGFASKNCNATTVSGTERVLIENCHGTRMAAECFVSACRGREATRPGQSSSKSLTYLRCSAIDCGRNAFNDVTCGPENTSVLYCRIVDVGGCAWEGASRFVKFVGNYVRNAGTVAMGNLGTYNRDESFPKLGAGQHIVADNVFESNVPYGGCAIRSAVGSTQVIVANNLFINFGSSAVEASGRFDPTHYASANTTITGNVFDMTEIGDKSTARTAVSVSASDAIISDNQIYVRGRHDPNVTAIKIDEPAVNLAVHDNLIRNCGRGIVTGRIRSRVAEVVDPLTFAAATACVPLDHRRARQCEGWRLVWLSGDKPSGESIVDAVVGAARPDTVQFKLRQPRQTKLGDAFEVIPPSANWNIHDNTISGCGRPVDLDSYGGSTSLLRNNTISRGEAEDVEQAVVVSGRFTLIGNSLLGFDRPGSSALVLNPDRLGKVCPNVIRDNVFQRCDRVVKEGHKGAWKASHTGGNIYSNCRDAPKH